MNENNVLGAGTSQNYPDIFQLSATRLLINAGFSENGCSRFYTECGSVTSATTESTMVKIFADILGPSDAASASTSVLPARTAISAIPLHLSAIS